MARLSLEQVTTHARSVGLSGESLAIAVAIAGWNGSPNAGESGGNPAAVGDRTLANGKWGPSYGLWQVRSLNAERGTGTERDANQLSDPAYNARSMFTISSGGTNWQPWSVYTSGKYKANLDQAREAAGVAANTARPKAKVDLGGAVGLGADLGLWPQPAMMRRTGWFFLGVLVLLIGLAVINRTALGESVHAAVKIKTGGLAG